MTVPRQPFGLRWRAHYQFTTLVVGVGILTDLLAYSVVIPVLPFQLERLGYNHVSSLSSWILVIYSAALALGTIPTAIFSERYNSRRIPLLGGLVVLLGSQIMLMEAPTYWVMCLARALQGVGSAIVWTVGLALLADVVPPSLVGQQMGIAMTGMSIGLLLGPTCGGAIYDRFGFRGPFIFALCVTFLDLIGRLLIIERHEALKWGFDPSSIVQEDEAVVPGLTSDTSDQTPKLPEKLIPEEITSAKKQRVTLLFVMSCLLKSSRALAICGSTLVYAIVVTSVEPVLPLYLNAQFGLNPSKVGLIFLAGVIPTLISSPLGGWLNDKYGSGWIGCASIALTLPWWGLLIIKSKLAVFIVFYAAQNFFVAGLIGPITSELASISLGIDGVGFGHVYGAFNLAYAVGSTVGPLIGGQIYDRTPKFGWMIICILCMGLLFLMFLTLAVFTGEHPILSMVMRRRSPLQEEPRINSVQQTIIEETKA